MVSLINLGDPLYRLEPTLLDQGGESHVSRLPIGLVELLLTCKTLDESQLTPGQPFLFELGQLSEQ